MTFLGNALVHDLLYDSKQFSLTEQGKALQLLVQVHSTESQQAGRQKARSSLLKAKVKFSTCMAKQELGLKSNDFPRPKEHAIPYKEKMKEGDAPAIQQHNHDTILRTAVGDGGADKAVGRGSDIIRIPHYRVLSAMPAV